MNSSSNQASLSRQQQVMVLTKAMEFETKGDYFTKLDRDDLAERAYTDGMELEQSLLGEGHPLVQQLREKLLLKKGTPQKSYRRKDMKALAESFQHEKHAIYLSRLGRHESAAREYEHCLTIEERILGKDHPMVSQLRAIPIQQ